MALKRINKVGNSFLLPPSPSIDTFLFLQRGRRCVWEEKVLSTNQSSNEMKQAI